MTDADRDAQAFRLARNERNMPEVLLPSTNSFRLSHPASLILLPLLREKLDSRMNVLDNPSLKPVSTLPASAVAPRLKSNFRLKPSGPMILPRLSYASGQTSVSDTFILRIAILTLLKTPSHCLSAQRLPASRRLRASTPLPHPSR